MPVSTELKPIKVNKAVSRYLNRYAEPESNLQLPDDVGSFDHVLVIPCFQESSDQIQKVTANIRGNFLTILVANSSSTDDELGKAMVKELLSDTTLLHQQEQMIWYEKEGRYFLLMDRISTPIPKRQGVGLARKVGTDVALRLICEGMVKHPYIGSTDADAVLPEDYWQAQKGKNAAALIYPFKHVPELGHETACALYEIAMLYYAAGLKQAGSPYGFTTIGSTLAIHYEHYAAVGGFPKRSAAEDFYLLNKLNKTGTVESLNTPEILIAGRLSARTPVGTGRAIEKISSNPDAYRFYDPECFRQLGQLLKALQTSQSETSLEGHFTHPLQSSWLVTTNFESVWLKNRHQDDAVYQKFIHDWMDGFRTLKFIHYCRDNQYPSVPLSKIVGSEWVPTTSTDLEDILETLRK